MTSALSRSPGITNGMPGGYGVMASAATRPDACDSAPTPSAAKNASRGVSTGLRTHGQQVGDQPGGVRVVRPRRDPATSAKPATSRSMSASVLPIVRDAQDVSGAANSGWTP